MDAHAAIALGRHTLLVVATIALPILGVGLVLGLLIAVFQAVTSLQEQTLAMVPKILATAGALFLLLPWILDRLTQFALEVLQGLGRYGGAS